MQHEPNVRPSAAHPNHAKHLWRTGECQARDCDLQRLLVLGYERDIVLVNTTVSVCHAVLVPQPCTHRHIDKHTHLGAYVAKFMACDVSGTKM